MTNQTKTLLGIGVLAAAGYFIYNEMKKAKMKPTTVSFVKNRPSGCSECLNPRATTCNYSTSTQGCPKNELGQQMIRCCLPAVPVSPYAGGIY
jgi:hypothetical protein